MKKEELTAIGLTDEQANQVFALNGKEIEKHKAAAEAAQAKAAELAEQLTQRDADIAELKKADAAGLRQKLDELQGKYDKDRQAWEEQRKQREYQDRRSEFFQGVEFADGYAKRGVLAEFDEKQFPYSDADRTFTGAKEWLEGLKSSSPSSFQSGAVPRVVKGSSGGGAPTVDFSKMTYSQMLSYQKEHPEAAIE